MQKQIDFTNCRRIIGKAYNGANGKKIGVEYEGNTFMLKFPPSSAGKATDLSYANSCISEHIASSIFNMLGIRAQETMLGTFAVSGKEKVVCACRDFTKKSTSLFDFCSIKNTVIDSEHGGTGTELEDILDTIEKQQFVNPTELLAHFWDMFVADALLGNFDRHNGNWGFLFDEETQKAEIAPVFDCGSCLLPQADKKTIEALLRDENELNARVFQFPTSAIKQKGKKINYYDFLTAAENKDCCAAMKRIFPRIDVHEIKAFIWDVPYISDTQKSFYETYTLARYEKIILPAAEKSGV